MTDMKSITNITQSNWVTFSSNRLLLLAAIHLDPESPYWEKCGLISCIEYKREFGWQWIGLSPSIVTIVDTFYTAKCRNSVETIERAIFDPSNI